jgi:hypothetical protein
MPGGNMLIHSRFLDTDPTGMTIRFSVPPYPGFTLDPGDGSAPISTERNRFYRSRVHGVGAPKMVYRGGCGSAARDTSSHRRGR